MYFYFHFENKVTKKKSKSARLRALARSTVRADLFCTFYETPIPIGNPATTFKPILCQKTHFYFSITDL